MTKVIIDKNENENERIENFFIEISKLLEKYHNTDVHAELNGYGVYLKFKDNDVVLPLLMREIYGICDKYDVKLMGVVFNLNLLFFSIYH